MRTTVRVLRRLALPLALVAAASCSSSTAPTPRPVGFGREAWTSAKLTSYSFDYEVAGYFIEYEGHWIHIVVRNGVVQSAIDLTTGQGEPAQSLQWFPTIDQLFDRAQAAEANGLLKSITYDPTYGYPTMMSIAGPPDASGTTYAKNLTAQ